MNTARMISIGLALALLALAAACNNDQGPGNEPTPGAATVALVTPNGDDGAVLLTLTGPGLGNAQPTSSTYRVYSRVAGSGELRVIVVGDLAATALLTVQVDDVKRIREYRGTVLEAASRSDAARGSLAGYGVTIAAAP